MRLIFHGKLRGLFGPSVSIDARSIADAIEGFSRQVDWPRDMPVRVVGYATEERLQEAPEQVDIMPAMTGGGGKFGGILLGAAMIGISFTGLGAALSTSLLVSGALSVATGVLGLFLKAPTMKGTKDIEASKYLGINRNTTAIGTPIPLAWGRINLSGHWLSLQSDSTNLSFGVFPA